MYFFYKKMVYFMSFIRYKQKGNKWYAYEITAFWDKDKKKPRQTSKYLGVSDSKGGEYNKPGRLVNPKNEKEILDFGDSFSINEVSKNTGFSEVIKASFSDYDSVMSLICYQILQGSSMQLCEDWSDNNIAKYLFPKASISSSSISRIIKSLGSENVQRSFFKNYISTFFNGKHGVLIDST